MLSVPKVAMRRERHDSVRGCEISSVTKVTVPDVGEIQVNVVKGDCSVLPSAVQSFIAENVKLCCPNGVYICDGSEEEAEEMTDKLVSRGMLTKLDKLDNWLALLFSND
jgi:phosphoenolpyruvate carboxykinase (GTP)